MDVLVSMPYDEQEYAPVYNTIVAVAKAQGLVAERVDKAATTAELIPTKIQKAIRECRLMVAEASIGNPNVLNEIGWAQALGKPVVIICHRKPEDLPFNLRALSVEQYDLGDLTTLAEALRKVLKGTTSATETLRAMLLPSSLEPMEEAAPFIVAASPLSYRRLTGKTRSLTVLRRTQSDYVGIRGILQAFGWLRGFDALPELLDPVDFPDSMLEAEKMNLFSIASPKANPWTRYLLSAYAQRWTPAFRFVADERTEDLRNVRVSLQRDDVIHRPHGWDSGSGDHYFRDFGLILRGPKEPGQPECMVMVLAGRSSLGTEAVCTAATNPEHIASIRTRLEALGVDLQDHKQPFYAIVSMKRARDDGREEAIPESLRIETVDILRRPE